MRRTALTVVTTIVGLVLLLQFKTHSAGAGGLVSLGPAAPRTHHSRSIGPTTPRQSRRGTPPASPTSQPSVAPTPTHYARTHSAPAQPSSITVTGQTVQTGYGPVQVKIVMTAGRLTDITAIQLPADSAHSSDIAAYAVPILRSEALQANSARIDIVSGATYTSDGYAQSLQSALDHA